MPTKRNETNFTRVDLKPCYLVKTRDGRYWMVFLVDEGIMILTNGFDRWEYLSSWDMGLSHSKSSYDSDAHNLDIMEVYGHVTGSENYPACGYISTDNRPLLWSRESERVEMTLEEIEKKLGYKVKIVSEKENRDGSSKKM